MLDQTRLHKSPDFALGLEAVLKMDGWVFTMKCDTRTDRSHLAILNAQDLQAILLHAASDPF